MNCKKIKPGIAALSLLAISMMACNNQNGDYISSDTTTTTMVTPDTMATTALPADTMMVTPADTVAAQKTTAASTKPAKKYRATLEVVPVTRTAKYNKDRIGVYDYAEVMPMFPGGQSALEDYINNHINYPQNAIDNSKEGRVQMKFTIDENGKIMNVRETGAQLGDGLDKEAVRVISNMPTWKPGTIKGEAVKVNVTLPIVFKIEE